jgi:hypothetical protein
MLLRQFDEYVGIVIERLQVSFRNTAEQRILTLGFVDESGRKQGAHNQPQQRRNQESLPKGKPLEEADQIIFHIGIPRWQEGDSEFRPYLACSII